MKNIERKMKQRWERLLARRAHRGEYCKKRCAYYTKPGPRPRSRPRPCPRSYLPTEKKTPESSPNVVSNADSTNHFLFNPFIWTGTDSPYIWEIPGNTLTTNIIDTTGSVTNSGYCWIPATDGSYTINYGYTSPFIPGITTQTYPSITIYPIPEETAEEKAVREKRQRRENFQQKIRESLLVTVPANCQNRTIRAFQPAACFEDVSPAECVALSLLKSMLPSEHWKRYLRYGFVMVKGHSGLLYQIIRRHSHIIVYLRKEKIAELCIHFGGLSKKIPPTDEVIGKKIMVELSEMEVWTQANVHNSTRWSTSRKPAFHELQQLVKCA